MDEHAGTMRGSSAALGCLLVTAPLVIALLVAAVGVFSLIATS